MHTTLRILVGDFMACILALPAPLTAEGLPDRDTKEIADYVLTDAGLAKYRHAVQKLKPVAEQIPADCDTDAGPKSLNAMAARLDGVPAVESAFKAAGMTSREYLVFSFSVFQNGMAAWALAQPGGKLPPSVKMANVNFYRAHEA